MGHKCIVNGSVLDRIVPKLLTSQARLTLCPVDLNCNSHQSQLPHSCAGSVADGNCSPELMEGTRLGEVGLDGKQSSGLAASILLRAYITLQRAQSILLGISQ